MTRSSVTHVAKPLERWHMPTDYRISLASYTHRGTSSEVRIPEDFGPKQSMRGFEDTYRNIIDYIVRITYKIWEDRDVEYITDVYSENSRVFDDYGLQQGNKKIISDTHHTISAYSDIQLIADEIVWAGDDDVGYHTSHRTIIRGTNDGPSKYGSATNRYVDVLVIANCVALENDIFLEHVLYNHSSTLRQLGHDLTSTASRLTGEAPAGWPRDAATWQSLRSATSPNVPISVATPTDGFDVDKFARHALEKLWNEKSFDVLESAYAPGFYFQGATDRKLHGAKSYQRMMQELITAFPDMELQVDEVYWMGNESDGFMTSERWSAEATHTGSGIYGEPTGKAVQIWGITQHRISGGCIQQEWMLFNELDLMMQLVSG